MFISYTVLFKYFLKDVPLLVMKVDTQLAKRAQSYGSNYKSYSFATKAIIKGSKILADTGMIYNLTYTLIVSMCLKNKLFASLVLLDVFFQVPTLSKNLIKFSQLVGCNLEAKSLIIISNYFFHTHPIFFQHLYVLQF